MVWASSLDEKAACLEHHGRSEFVADRIGVGIRAATCQGMAHSTTEAEAAGDDVRHVDAVIGGNGLDHVIGERQVARAPPTAAPFRSDEDRPVLRLSLQSPIGREVPIRSAGVHAVCGLAVPMEGEDQPIEMNFQMLVISLSTSALVQLGVAPNPATGKTEKDLMSAKQTIEILGILQEKTKGNLTPEEFRLLEQCLYDLKMSYVTIAKK